MFKRIGMVWLAGLAVGFLVFVLGVLLGWLVPADEAKQQIVLAVVGKFNSILSGVDYSWELVIRIFLNNLLVAVILLVTGILIVVPLIILFSNGVIIGVFIDLLSRTETLAPGTLAASLVSLVPHGIFELTALFLAGALGTVLTIKLIFAKWLLPHYTRGEVATATAVGFALIVVPLLFIAAVVETFISPGLAERVQRSYVQEENTAAILALVDTDELIAKQCLPASEPVSVLSANALAAFYEPEQYQLMIKVAQAKQQSLHYLCEDEAELLLTSYLANSISLTELTNYLEQNGLSDAEIEESGDYWLVRVYWP